MARPLVLVALAALLVGCTSPSREGPPPETPTTATPTFASAAGFDALFREMIEDARAERPNVSTDSIWSTSVDEADGSLRLAIGRLAEGTAMASVQDPAEARAFYLAARANANVTASNVEDHVHRAAIAAGVARVTRAINATRAGGLDADGLATIAIAEDFTGQTAELLRALDKAQARFDQDRSLASAQDLVLQYEETNATLWAAERLAAGAASHPGALHPAAADPGLLREARVASDRLPLEGPSGPVSSYMLAKRRMPAWLDTSAANGWSEGQVEIAAQILIEARAAERYARGSNGTTTNASAALDALRATIRTPLDDVDAQRAWHWYQRGASAPEWYVLAEEAANVAPLRAGANAKLLG